MFNQVQLTGIVKSCNSVSFEGKPASVLYAEIFGDSSSVYMVSFDEITAEAGDIISVKGSLTTRKFDVKDDSLIEDNRRGYVRVLVDERQVQKVTVDTGSSQKTSESKSDKNAAAKPAEAPLTLKENESVLDGATVENVEGNKVRLAGYENELTFTNKAKNTSLLKAGSFVKLVIWTKPETGKQYINAVYNHGKELQKTA